MSNFRLFFIMIMLIGQFSHSEDYKSQMRNKLKEKFSDVVLIINFNHPYYNNIEFLKELYSCFDDIVFYGEKESPDVICVPTTTGYILSGVISDVCARFPDKKGYLFLQDDCALHFWNLLQLDLDRIWYAIKFNDGKLTNDKCFSIINMNGQIVSGYPWNWGRTCCFNNASVAFRSLSNDDQYYLNENLGMNNIPSMMCEVFYVPSRFKNDFLRLNSIFNDVFCEVAVPSMLCSMDLIENWEQLTMLGGEGVGYDGLGGSTLIKYPMEVSWVHPIKFSSQKNRDLMLKIVEERVALN